jgi:hypothetical protein
MYTIVAFCGSSYFNSITIKENHFLFTYCCGEASVMPWATFFSRIWLCTGLPHRVGQVCILQRGAGLHKTVVNGVLLPCGVS